MLSAACHRLKDGTQYHDRGAGYFDKPAKTAQTNRRVSRLENLGCTVTLTPVAA